MKPETESNEAWNSHDLRLIREVELFQHKPRILKKAEAHLETLADALRWELQHSPADLLPPGADRENGQLVRGENHKGFPFRSLDLPQFFNKTEFFTFRTLFWWGHYLGFALLLKGPELEAYSQNIAARKSEARFSDVNIAAASSPWEWSLEEENFKRPAAMASEEIVELIEKIGYVKLCRIFPLGDESFSNLNWAKEGVRAYNDLVVLAAASA